MNEFEQIRNEVLTLTKSMNLLRKINIFPAQEIEELEAKGLKEISDRSKHIVEDIVYSYHQEISDDNVS
tara:strand:+ start:1733 stop:1939 length:207 start_codon:yes stop_codon:yes gene_type:complete